MLSLKQLKIEIYMFNSTQEKKYSYKTNKNVQDVYTQ